jgi:hypothetical protein
MRSNPFRWEGVCPPGAHIKHGVAKQQVIMRSRHRWYRFGREYRVLQAMDGVGTDATSPSANIGWSGIGVERVLRSTDLQLFLLALADAG